MSLTRGEPGGSRPRDREIQPRRPYVREGTRPRPYEREIEQRWDEPIWDEPGHPSTIVVERPAPRRDALDLGIRVLAGLALVMLVALLASALIVIATISGAGARVGEGVGGLIGQAGAGIGRAAQGLADRLDPAHPPRGTLAHDAEIDQLLRLGAGAEVGRAGEYIFTLAEVRRRDGATNPNQIQYAAIRRRYETPRETRVLGVLVRTDRGEAEHALYRSESFQLGRSYFKVNWLSIDRQEMALVRYRNADTLSVDLKFQYD